MFLRKNRRKNTHFVVVVVFILMWCVGPCSISYTLHQWSKRKRKKSIVFQSQDLCAMSLFSPLTFWPVYLSFSLLCWTFHSQVMSQSSLQVLHLVLKQPDNLLHQVCGLHILKMKVPGHIFSAGCSHCDLLPALCRLISFVLYSAVLCKSRKWAPSADFSLVTSEQLSPTTQSYVLLPRTI